MQPSSSLLQPALQPNTGPGTASQSLGARNTPESLTASPCRAMETGRWEAPSGDLLVQPPGQSIHRWIGLLRVLPRQVLKGSRFRVSKSVIQAVFHGTCSAGLLWLNSPTSPSTTDSLLILRSRTSIPSFQVECWRLISTWQWAVFLEAHQSSRTFSIILCNGAGSANVDGVSRGKERVPSPWKTRGRSCWLCSVQQIGKEVLSPSIHPQLGLLPVMLSWPSPKPS